MPKRLDLVGRRFGWLTVSAYAGRSRYGRAAWLCTCDCGKSSVVEGNRLTCSNATHCGCRTSANRSTHGMSGTRAYRIWQSMHQRCSNPKNTGYADYGGRGITVCERWASFENFYADMGAPPSQRHSLDRKDGTKDYEPSNCRWATPKEQLRNTRRNVFLEYDGKRLPISHWAEIMGINDKVLHERIRRGDTLERAFRRFMLPMISR